MIRCMACCVIAMTLSACGHAIAPPSSSQVEQGNYGPPPTDYRPQIEVFWADRLFESGSAKFAYAPPRKAFTQRRSNKNVFGWVVVHEITAKTRSGKFAKPKRYAAFFIDGRLSHVTETVKENGYYKVIGYAY